MSIATTVRTAGPFAGTGSLVALPFAFKVFAASDLAVQRTSTSGSVTTLTLTTHYSVSLNADQDTSPGGTVTLVTALASGETAMVTSNVAATQPLQLASGGPFLPQQIEDALDRTIIIIQQQGVLGGQTLRLPLGESVLELPAAVSRASMLLGFDASGQPVMYTPGAYGGDASTINYLSMLAGSQSLPLQADLDTRPNMFRWLTAAERADVISGALLLDVGPKIQAAIDAVYAAGGGVLWFPVGKYKCGQRLYMRRGVTLMGPPHRIPTGSMYPTGVEGTIYGIARIVATSGVAGGFLFWDFKDTDKLRRPYGAQVHNIMLDCANQSSGAGVYITCLPAGEGVFGNGWAGAATAIDGMIILSGPSHGVFVESTDNEKINCQILRTRVGFCAGNGIYCYKCLDVKIDYCFIFDVRGDGLVMEGCATERVTDNDIFNVDGHGVVMDGFDARYRDNAVENNGKHGYYIRANITGITDKRYRITGGRVGTNSYDYDNTYDNIHIEDRAGTASCQVSISQVVFGPQAHVGTTNRVRHQLHSAALPTQSGSSAIGCFFVGADRHSGNPYIDDNSLQSFNFSDCLDGSGQEIVQKWYPLTAGSGSLWQPNVLRGVTRFKTQNTSAAVLWDIFGENASFIGKEIYILIDDMNTGVDFSGTNLHGNGGVDLVAGASTKGKIIRAICIDGTIWSCQVMG